MELNEGKIDEVVLALLQPGLHDGALTWKSFDWDVMNRLHEKGYISAPNTKAKFVMFTGHGLTESGRLLRDLFGIVDK